jgi:wyosine [tRNA(Phe)-imidazoG37] synthetase (radical SAM superfamily)
MAKRKHMLSSVVGYPHLFGPVYSRRLGRSLGVDLLPHKTCSLDCVYCERGATTHLTTSRAEFAPVEAIIAELDKYLGPRPDLDAITFSGSGEPTLYAGLGRIIQHLKTKHPRYRVVILTNGTLFSKPEVRREVLQADLVVPSLDGATPESFQAINRPAHGITVEQIVEGLVALRSEYQGSLVLEVFVVPGVNDTNREVEALQAAAERIRPDAIQLNRLERPSATGLVPVASDELLTLLVQALEPLPVFAVPSRRSLDSRRIDDQQLEQDILARLERGARDTTTVALLLGLNERIVAKAAHRLLDDGRLVRVPTAQKNRLVLERAHLKEGSEEVA